MRILPPTSLQHPSGIADILSDFLYALEDKNYTAESFNVFNIGNINRLRAFGIEMSFPIQATIPATEALFVKASEELAAGRHHSVPVSLRFVKSSDACLAMSHGRDTVTMEIGMLVTARGSEDLLRDYERFFMSAPFHARPHWGLDLSVLNGWQQVVDLYGPDAANAWRGVYERYNRSGTFDGRLTDRLGISMRPKR